MSEKILFVDDEPNVLDGIRRQLRRDFDLVTAVGGSEGLERIADEGPFAVIVSDMRMPEMDGAAFLTACRETAPDAVRMILSGQSDLQQTIEAVNQGQIFRFLTKPCSREGLTHGVQSALEQYRLLTAERDLLEKTLSGSIQLLTELLGMVRPRAFSRATRLQRYAEQVGERVGVENPWQLRVAALLSQIGCITVDEDVLARLHAGQPISDAERAALDDGPAVAGKLLANVPRLESVSRIIRHHGAPAAPEPGDRGMLEPQEALCASVLRAVVRFDELVGLKLSREEALAKLAAAGQDIPKDVLAAVEDLRIAGDGMIPRSLPVSDLRPFMVASDEIRSLRDVLLVPPGQELNESILVRLRTFAERGGVQEPCHVLVPA